MVVEVSFWVVKNTGPRDGRKKMIQYYSTVKENGWGYAKKKAHDLERSGNEILDIVETMVPRGENADGKIYYVPGYRILVDDGREPRYKGYMYAKMLENNEAIVNENLQDPPGVGERAPWLWG